MNDCLKNQYILYFASFCWSFSSLVSASLLPLMMEESAGMSREQIGWIEAIAISSCFLMQVGSGWISDAKVGRKKLIVCGSLFSFFAKVLIAVCSSPFGLGFGRILDRASKGVRSAPTDAALVDNTKSISLGRTFGLRQCTYTAGAVAGSLVTIGLMKVNCLSYSSILLVASLPNAVAAYLVLKRFKPNAKILEKSSAGLFAQPVKLRENHFLSLFGFYSFVFFLFLARMSESFIALHLRDLGMPHVYLPLIFVFSGVIHVLMSLPSGRWADQFSVHSVATLGIFVQVASLLCFSLSSNWGVAFLACGLSGLSLALTQNTVRAMVAQLAAPNRRGKAFANFYLTCGVAALVSNSSAGKIADKFGLEMVFLLGAFYSVISLVILMAYRQDLEGRSLIVGKVVMTVKGDMK